MGEVQDIVLPLLKNIQADMSGLKAEMRDLKAAVARTGEVNEALSRYITYTLGLHGENKADIDDLKLDLDVLKGRLDAAEKPAS
jgi:hypothetical protein